MMFVTPLDGPRYDLAGPAAPESAVLFSSPHSGRDYPADFITQSQLSTAALRSSEDAFVDQLFATAPLAGAHLLMARRPRAWLDLNRAADELDPAVIADAPRGPRSPRLSAGLGVIPRIVGEGREILRGKIPLAEARARIENWHRPYHDALAQMLETRRARFGIAVLVDCHSMPREALAHIRFANNPRPDVILGDRYGSSCAPDLTDLTETLFREAGFRVARNTPFAGGYITQHYGRPTRGQHALQIELDRSLYMDERTLTPLPVFSEVVARIGGIVHGLVSSFPGSKALAAE